MLQKAMTFRTELTAAAEAAVVAAAAAVWQKPLLRRSAGLVGPAWRQRGAAAARAAAARGRRLQLPARALVVAAAGLSLAGPLRQQPSLTEASPTPTAHNGAVGASPSVRSTLPLKGRAAPAVRIGVILMAVTMTMWMRVAMRLGEARRQLLQRRLRHALVAQAAAAATTTPLPSTAATSR